MSSGENILTRTQDLFTGNVDGPSLRKEERRQRVLEAQAATAKAEKLLRDVKKSVDQLTPVQERLALDKARQDAEWAQLPITAAQVAQKLETRGQVDALDINRTQAMRGIETDNNIKSTNNQYEKISGLLRQSMDNEAAARDAFIADNAALRGWFAEQGAVNQDFIKEQTQKDFLDRLEQTARAMAPLLAVVV